MGAIYRSQFERDVAAPPPHELTLRDLDIVHDVYRHGYLDSRQITTLHGSAESNHKRIGNRLNKLFHHGYLRRPVVSLRTPRTYSMTHKGGSLLKASRRILEAKRYDTRRPSRLYLDHQLGISDFMLNVELTCRAAGNVRLIHEDEIFERASPQAKRHRGWPVCINWRGQMITTWVIPDRIFGLEFVDKPQGGNRRYFALEYDRGTMPIERSNPYQTCYMKKLVGYAHTYADELHKKHLGVPYFYTLTVTTSAARSTAIVEKSARHTRSLAPLSAFLYASQPRAPSLGRFQNVLEMQWQTAASKTVTLPS